MTRKSKAQDHGGDSSLARHNDAHSSEPPAKANEYKVGPGCPPKEFQFKPGQSGNPKGAKRRPRSILPDLKAIFEGAFNKKVKITDGERERMITLWDAGMQQLARQFAKGDRYARRDAFWIAERLGSEFLTPQKAFDGTLAADRQAILDAYVERQMQGNVSAAPSPVIAPAELLDDDAPDKPGRK
jgi:Family of unknown function (DUF5681)